jgi:hypothetical protein
MDTKPVNPLAAHFRRPSIYFKLPSKGKFWADGGLDLPVTGDIPVYPMTNSDEITIKTPDALMNGSSVVNVIHSCCPNITDAWKMPSVDVDAVLIAIRIASYGAAMPITSKCPKCGEEHDYDIDLTSILDRMKCPDFSTPLDYNGLKIKLQPQKYFGVNRASMTQFEEQKIMQALNDPNIDDTVKNNRIKEGMMRLLELNNSMLVSGTEYIETEDGTKVTDPEFIGEFYKNAESMVIKKIEEKLKTLAEEAAVPTSTIVCGSCSHNYEVPLEFDYSRFFVTGS